MNISAKCSSRQPHVVLPVKLRCPVRKLTCVSRQTCLNKSGKRHSKPPMETGTAIKTAAAPPVCVMPAFFLMLRPETVSSMCWILVDPSRLLSPWFARARPTLALQSGASRYMHVNNLALEALWVFWGSLCRCRFMNGRPCPPVLHRSHLEREGRQESALSHPPRKKTSII